MSSIIKSQSKSSKQTKGLSLIRLFLYGLLLLVTGLFLFALPVLAQVPETYFQRVPDDVFVWGFCRVIAFISTSAGALLTTIAGIFAVFSAALGNYRTAAAVVFVGSGAFMLQSITTLFFEQRCELVYVDDGEGSEVEGEEGDDEYEVLEDGVLVEIPDEVDGVPVKVPDEVKVELENGTPTTTTLRPEVYIYDPETGEIITY